MGGDGSLVSHNERSTAFKTLDARLRGHDDQEVVPAQAGMQKPYIQLQAALGLSLGQPLCQMPRNWAVLLSMLRQASQGEETRITNAKKSCSTPANMA